MNDLRKYIAIIEAMNLPEPEVLNLAPIELEALYQIKKSSLQDPVDIAQIAIRGTSDVDYKKVSVFKNLVDKGLVIDIDRTGILYISQLGKIALKRKTN